MSVVLKCLRGVFLNNMRGVFLKSLRGVILKSLRGVRTMGGRCGISLTKYVHNFFLK